MKTKKIQEVIYGEIIKRKRHICYYDLRQVLEQIKQHMEVMDGKREWVDVEKYPKLKKLSQIRQGGEIKWIKENVLTKKE